MNNHYYFKFWKENRGLEKWEDVVKKDKIEEGDNVQLSIYYDDHNEDKKFKECLWKAVEWEEAIKHFEMRFEVLKQAQVQRQGVEKETAIADMQNQVVAADPNVQIAEKQAKQGEKSKQGKQIKLFFTLNNEKPGDNYFWIFNDDRIYVFKGRDLKVVDGNDKMIDDNLSNPKSISVICFKIFKKKDLPEFFSNINTNQGYNRGTISKLKGVENEFADSIILDKPISVRKTNFYNYLSPVQFETLIFLIFNQNGNYCSAFRGGTLKKYDLKIFIKNPIDRIPKDDYWVQIKKKDEVVILQEDSEKYIIIYTGKSKNDKILGIDWICSIIDNDESIINWLKYAVFEEKDKKYINFKWEN